MEYFTSTLINFDGDKRIVPHSENPEQYIKDYFENYVRYTSDNAYDMTSVNVFEELPSKSSVTIGDWFVLKSKTEDSETHSLYFVESQDNGWVMRNEIPKFVLKKQVTFETVHHYGSPFVDEDSMDHIESEKRRLILQVKELLCDIENTSGKENKIMICEKLFTILGTDEGKRFIYTHDRFKETVRNKLLEFIFMERLEQAEQWYFELFGYHVLRNFCRNYSLN